MTDKAKQQDADGYSFYYNLGSLPFIPIKALGGFFSALSEAFSILENSERDDMVQLSKDIAKGVAIDYIMGKIMQPVSKKIAPDNPVDQEIVNETLQLPLK